MIHPNHPRAAFSSRRIGAALLCCLLFVAGVEISLAQAVQGITTPKSDTSPVGHPIEPTPGKRQLREAASAYLAGAKKLEQNNLDAAEEQFQRALKLDPENRNYAIAISVTRDHRVIELVRHAASARQTGDQKTADTLLAKARAVDPQNPFVLEHTWPSIAASTLAQSTPSVGATSLADQGQILATANAREPWRIKGPVLAGAIRLAPEPGLKAIHFRGSSGDVIRNVALAYGIRAIIDDSVEQKQLRFDLEGVTYKQAMAVAMSMAHVFASPVDETSVIVAKDDSANRQRLERELEETIYVPGLATDQINELAQVIRSVFDVKQPAIQTGMGSIVVRAPEDVLEPMNRTLKDLIDGNGEVMIEVKLYEVNTTHLTDVGAALPTQFNVFNVDQAANAIVNANQTLVQQAVAQGLIKPGTSNLQIALALIGLGLVKSSLASNLIGVIGGGITQTGISASTNTTFNLNLNSSDTRALDDVQLRVGDHQAAVFREGNRYPITTSTYSSGLSNAASSLAGQSFHGTPIASLLAQFAGGTSATIPQISYEDLGLTLKATSVIEKSGRINMLLDLKIQALSGSTLGGNPVLLSRQFATDLTVADGESALMVSNVTRNEAAAMTGLPGLSELPGFQLPTESSRQRDTSQLVVVVTPRIVRRRSDLVQGPRIPTRSLAEN